MAKPPSKQVKPQGVTKPKAGLPSVQVKNVLSTILQKAQAEEKIPNAALVYGIGAAVIFAFGLYHFFTGAWLTGFLVSVLAIGLLGYSLHFMRAFR